MTFSHLISLAAGLSMAGLLTPCGGAGNQGSVSTLAIEESNPAESEVFWFLKDIRSEMCPNWLNHPEKEAVDVAYLILKYGPGGNIDLSTDSEADVRSAILAWCGRNCD